VSRTHPPYRLRRLAVVAVATFAALLALVAAASGGRTAAGTTLTVRGLNVDWVSFDFQASNRNDNLPPTMAAYDRLLAYGPGLKLVPYIATSWTLKPSSRPRSVTFRLKRNVTCSDGSRVTPLVVLNSFKRLLLGPKSVNLVPNNFGPGPFHLSASLKRWTFTLRTETPFRNLLSGFAWAGSGIVCPAGLQALQSNPRALETAMYGSGPYTLVNALHADSITFKLRPEWKWGPLGTTAKTLPETLVYRYVANETTAANLLLTGGMDIGWATGPDADRLKAETSLVHKTGQNFAPTMMAFNMFPGHATTDERVREALMTAIDPRAWNQAAYGGYGVITPTILVPGMDCYDKKAGALAPQPNMTKAAQVLQSAGYTLSDGKLVKDGKQLRLRVISPSNVASTAADYVISQLNRLGIATDLGGPSSYGTDALNGNFDVGFITSTAVAPLPGINLPSFSGATPPKGANLANTGAGDPTLNRLALYSTQYIGAKGCALFAQLQQLYLKKHYLYGMSAPTQQMVARGWDFLPVQLWEVYSFKKK
jgi:peptide/nickel transport system substrate-binding protein